MGEKKLWHQHYPEEIPFVVYYDSKPLQEYLVKSAELYGEKKALHFMGKDITFSELFEESKRMAHYMQTLGVEKGDRVAIMLPNSPQSVIGYYGALFAGATVVSSEEHTYELQSHV